MIATLLNTPIILMLCFASLHWLLSNILKGAARGIDISDLSSSMKLNSKDSKVLFRLVSAVFTPLGSLQTRIYTVRLSVLIVLRFFSFFWGEGGHDNCFVDTFLKTS